MQDPVSITPFSVVVRPGAVAYDGARLFADFELTLAAGRTLCLLGPSGVGKSTLLRLMAGLVPPAPDTQIAANDGLPLAGRIAWMGQQDLLCPWLNATDNILLGARLRGQTPDRARADRLLDSVGLAGRGGAKPNELSGGQRQRVALARTLMEDRPFVLMDEPFTALDAITRWRLQALAARLLSGRTVVLVTHDPREALRLGHEIRVLSGFPARLGPPISPAGAPPRDLADANAAELEAALLAELATESAPA